MADCPFEVLHCVPRYLLSFYDRFVTGDLDGEGLQAWWNASALVLQPLLHVTTSDASCATDPVAEYVSLAY
jgi:hypothetical protein